MSEASADNFQLQLCGSDGKTHWRKSTIRKGEGNDDVREESGGNIKNKQEDGSGLIKRRRNERHSPPGSTCYKTASQTIRKCSLRLKKQSPVNSADGL